MGNVPSDVRGVPDSSNGILNCAAHPNQHYCGDGSAAGERGGILSPPDVRPDHDYRGTTCHVSTSSTANPSTVAAALHSVDELFQGVFVPNLSEQQHGSKFLPSATQPNPTECETAATTGMSAVVTRVGEDPATQPKEHRSAQSAGSTAADDEGNRVVALRAKRKSAMQTTTTGDPGYSDFASEMTNAAYARQDGRRKRPANDNGMQLAVTEGRLPAGGSSSGATLLRQWLAAGGWAAPAFVQARSHAQSSASRSTPTPLTC